MDQKVAAAWLALQHADTDPLDAVRACETIKAFADARQMSAIGELYALDPPQYDPTGRSVEPAAAEVATALHWTPGAAQNRCELAQELVDGLPGVHAALARGLVDLPKAREIANGTCGVSEHLRTDLAAQACEYAAQHTIGQLRAWLASRLAAIDPEAIRRRRKKACAQRRVWIQTEADGMATLGAYLTAEEAQACFNSIHEAVSNHEGSVDMARADQLVALLTGLQIGAPVPVQVIITDDGPELAGHGPISAEHAASLTENAVRIHIDHAGATNGYRPGVRLARWVRSRDRHCRFPGCRRPAVRCDLDHVVPYPAGPTQESNLACLCRYHHRLKTHADWRVSAHPDRTLQWTSPRGHVYFSFPGDP